MENEREITAIILVAGVGRRLGAAAAGPKVLIDFDGRSLLARHLAALEAHGVTDIALTVGYQQDAIRQELDRLGFGGRVELIDNPRYRDGSLVSLWVQAARLRRGSPVLLMDGDVLYDQRMIARLLAATAENALLVDRQIEAGDEPVKICFRGDAIVDFRKRPTRLHEWYGESVGFFRFSPDMAARLADRCADYVARGETGQEYEEAIRDLILEWPERFGAEDISDLAWTEIDFEADVNRARQEVLPRLAG